MGREVRRVPPYWEHPKNGTGEHQPKFDEDYATASARWKAGYEEWKDSPQSDCEFWEWVGMPPDEEYYRPAWPNNERTHLQMYETTTEGTPISPVMETPEELAKWLADNNASAFGGQTATYEAWLDVCLGSPACSAVCDATGMHSGVEAFHKMKTEKAAK